MYASIAARYRDSSAEGQLPDWATKVENHVFPPRKLDLTSDYSNLPDEEEKKEEERLEKRDQAILKMVKFEL